ncbi:MAG: hypothetical protein AAB434_00360 [Planctomycetota bacterium]
MPHRGTSWVLVIALLLARGLVPVGAEDDKARAVLSAGLTKVGKQVVGLTKESVVAMLQVRCETEADPLQASCGQIQLALQQALLKNGVYLFKAEAEHPLKVEYAEGALPKGVLFKNEDVAEWKDKQHAEYLIEPRVKTTGGKPSLHLTVFDLKKGSVAQRQAQELPKADGCDYAKVCDLGLLPAMNQEILLFAFSRVGQQVRSGECSELPGDPMWRLGRQDFGVQGGYKFGKKIQWKDALPGDVLTNPMHVMVLIKPLPKQTGSSIVHQNTQDKRFVVLDHLRDDQMKDMIIWRPTAKDD